MSLRKKIKNDMLEQLKKQNIKGEYFEDLVDDYMAMWDVKNKLIEDIKTKGVSIKYQNGENQWGYKKNDSVGELQRTNNQMLRLLDSLGLKASVVEEVDVNEEEYL